MSADNYNLIKKVGPSEFKVWLNESMSDEKAPTRAADREFATLEAAYAWTTDQGYTEYGNIYVDDTAKPPDQALVDGIRTRLATLDNEGRVKLFEQLEEGYCRDCGRYLVRDHGAYEWCQCTNDE